MFKMAKDSAIMFRAQAINRLKAVLVSTPSPCCVSH